MRRVTYGVLMTVAAARMLAAAPGPAVTLEYSRLLDGPCFAALNRAPDPAAVDELTTTLPVWRSQWERDAPPLFAEVEKLTGQSFKFHETIAAVITCPTYPSMSIPLMLNARRFLKSTAPDGRPPEDAKAFSRMIFHELLHRYVKERVAELPGGTTPLLQKYKDEPQVVRSHLHNVALMQVVYKALGRTDDFAESRTAGYTTSAIAGLRGAGDMDRALAIIEAEKPETLVRELAGR